MVVDVAAHAEKKAEKQAAKRKEMGIEEKGREVEDTQAETKENQNLDPENLSKK